MHALHHDQFYVPGENAGKAALNAYSLNGNQRRSAALRIVLKGDLLQDAAGMRKVRWAKSPYDYFAVAFVLQLFGDGIKPERPKEHEQEDGRKAHPQPAQHCHFKSNRTTRRSWCEHLGSDSTVLGGVMFAVGCEPLVYIRMQAAQMHLRWCNCAW